MIVQDEINKQMPFLGGIIHQFRNWMGGIIGHSDLALATDNPSDMKEGLSIALELSEKSTELLGALSKFKNEKPGNLSSGDLASIGRDIRLLTDNWLKEKGFYVSENLSEAPAENIDLPLVRLTLLEDLELVLESIERGCNVEFKSGRENGISYVGFSTKVAAGTRDNKTIDPGQPKSMFRREFRVSESGDLDLLLFSAGQG